MNLTCPKCTSEMRHYERNRILVDQCTGCGGLFLDRGELEQLVAAENAWHAAQAAPPAPAQQPSHDDRPRYDRPRYDDRDDHDDRRDSRDYKPRKKKSSFLSELFEG